MSDLREILGRCADAIKENKRYLALEILDEAIRFDDNRESSDLARLSISVGYRYRVRNYDGLVPPERYNVISINHAREEVLLEAPTPMDPRRVVWCPMDRIISPGERVGS